MQFPKSIAVIPFFNCSLGSISSEDNNIAIKSEPLIILNEFKLLIKGIILLFICVLNSDNVNI